MEEKWLAPIVVVIFFINFIAICFFNSTQPLIAMKNEPEPFAIHPFPGLGETKSSSILDDNQGELLFIKQT